MTALKPDCPAALRASRRTKLSYLLAGVTAGTALTIAVSQAPSLLVPPARAQTAPVAAVGRAPVPAPGAADSVSGEHMPRSFADLAAKVRPAVVYISTEGIQPAAYSGGDTQPALPEPFRRFFGQPPGAFERFQGGAPARPVRGVGSGFIVSEDGQIVTNYHVIRGASTINVTLEGGKKMTARVVGTDPKTDLAVLKVDSDEPLPIVTFGNSDTTRVGDWVIAVGNPFGLGGSVNAGIVSARGRDIQSGPYDDYLQIDAPINRGNSGGPLFNTRGEVIGVNTAIFSPSGGNVGIGFAVPASMAQPVIDALAADGVVARGWMGVKIQGLTEEIAASVGLSEPTGAMVVGVEPDSPAARAGLRRGDVLLAVNEVSVKDVKAAVRAVSGHAPGDRVKVRVHRNNETLDLSADLVATPGTPRPLAAGDRDAKGSGLGVRVRDLTASDRERYGISADTEGALVVAVDPNSPAARSRIRPGDVIAMVGQQEVSDARSARDAIKKARGDSKRPVLVLVQRGRNQQFLAVG